MQTYYFGKTLVSFCNLDHEYFESKGKERCGDYVLSKHLSNNSLQFMFINLINLNQANVHLVIGICRCWVRSKLLQTKVALVNWLVILNLDIWALRKLCKIELISAKKGMIANWEWTKAELTYYLQETFKNLISFEFYMLGNFTSFIHLHMERNR